MKASIRNSRVLFALIVFGLLVIAGVTAWFVSVTVEAGRDEEPTANVKQGLILRSKRDTNKTVIETGLGRTDFRGYRVGDAYRFGAFPMGFQSGMPLPIWHRRRFPGTIAAEYTKHRLPLGTAHMDKVITRAAPALRQSFVDAVKDGSALIKGIGGGTTLLECFDTENSKRHIATHPRVAVVHIRIGDVLTNAVRMRATGLAPGVYAPTAKRLRDSGVHAIVLVGGVHMSPKKEDHSISKSVAYAREVAAIFAAEGIKSAMVSTTPDADLVMLVDVPLLVAQPKSGFSRIAIDVRKRRKLRWQQTLTPG